MRRLVVLSDLWGAGKSEWLNYYKRPLASSYEVVDYDICELGGIDLSLYEETVIHQQFKTGGIDRAVEQLLIRERGEVTILGFSMGGYIAWKAIQRGLLAVHFYGVSATRLRLEKDGINCPVHLFYGEKDDSKPAPSWLDNRDLKYTIVDQQKHDLYQVKKIANQITKYLLGFLLVLFTCTYSLAQISESGLLFDEISTIISDMPGSSGDHYSDPNATQATTWGSLLSDLLNGDYAASATKAATIDYDLVAFTDTNSGAFYYILRNKGSNYWGTYVYNPNYCRSLVVQSPHPKKDFNTGKEGIYIFEATEALFFCLSGTNRCNQSAYSTCSGTTSICGDSEAYRISDMAHQTESIFQQTTDALFSRFDNSHFISLHGFTKQSTDPYVILSNGTRAVPTLDYIDLLDDHLLAEDANLTFKMAHIDLSWSRLIGFTNTQGRLINSSGDHCSQNASATSGRFIHLEQEKTRLREDAAGWGKVANALKNTFPCSTVPITLPDFPKKIKLFPNPFKDHLEIEGDFEEIEALRIFNIQGQDCTAQARLILESSKKVILDLSNCPAGLFFVKTKTNVVLLSKIN